MVLLRLVAAQLDQADVRVPGWAGTDLRSGHIVGHRAADLRTLSPPETFERRHYLLYKWRRLGFLWLPARRPARGGSWKRGSDPFAPMMKAYGTFDICCSAIVAAALRLAVLPAELRLISP